MARVGNDAGIFRTLVAAEGPLSSAALAEKTNVDPVLMTRLLRYYQSYGMIKEEAEDAFTANNVTDALGTSNGEGGITFMGTFSQHTYLCLPEYLKSHGYKNPTNPVDAPFQAGFNTDEHMFVWLQTHPEHFERFMAWVSHQNRHGLPRWHDIFPFDEECGGNTTPDTVLFVDVGSALGRQSVALREKYPHLPGRIVIQDTEQVMAAAQPGHGIETMVYDFFTPQPARGARAYYLRNILHDHQDAQAREILANTMSAMDEESVILIDEMVLPEKGAHWRAANMDIMMMTCVAAKERSEREWDALLASVDLSVIKVWKYTECDDRIIVAKPNKFAR